MKEKCLDSGTIQAFLDGELKASESLKVSNHIGDCDACALALGEAEEETAFTFSTLESEFNTLVPTQRLWTKINDSIVEEKKSASVWQKIWSYVSVSLANPSIAAAAGILVVLGIFTAFLTLNPLAGSQIAGDQARLKDVPAPQLIPTNTENPENTLAVSGSNNAAVSTPAGSQTKTDQKIPSRDLRKAVQADYRPNIRNDFQSIPKPQNSPVKQPPTVENAAYLPGEESYVKTIASLTQTVNQQKNDSLRPSAQISFARDLAVVDDAIGKMQAEVKKNPKNEAAKQVLYSSYQNKIDLLNSVAEKSELMASLK